MQRICWVSTSSCGVAVFWRWSNVISRRSSKDLGICCWQQAAKIPIWFGPVYLNVFGKLRVLHSQLWQPVQTIWHELLANIHFLIPPFSMLYCNDRFCQVSGDSKTWIHRYCVPAAIDESYQSFGWSSISMTGGLGCRMVQEPWAWVLGLLLESAIVNILLFPLFPLFPLFIYQFQHVSTSWTHFTHVCRPWWGFIAAFL